MIPTHLLVFIFAFGVGINSSFAQETEFQPKYELLGDLRYRGVQAKEDIDETRTYHQLRARLGVKALVEESVTLTFRLATATSATSANQTLGDKSSPGMARRSFGLDWGYIEFKFLDDGKFWLGRTANPFWAPAKNQLVYDRDIAFEGMALKWEPKWSDSSAFFNFGAFMVNESYDKPYDTVDLGIVGSQIGYSTSGFTFHVSQHAFLNIQDRNITGVESGAKIDSYQGTSFDRYRGNTVYVDDPLLGPTARQYFFSNQYVVLTAGFEYKTKLLGGDLLIFADGIQNPKVTRQATGHEAGINYSQGATSIGLAHIAKESDSTVAAFTDSNANGGGTDTSGMRLILGYRLTKKSQINLNSFQAKRGVDTVTRDFTMNQLELVATF